ncbi:cytochrome c oxidase subunit 7B, mitochondrial-like [Protopterus annectens]|uniref:cytochrome c oxidase subunit 7B, mitochondrial-like n=1 Tax=Protopterus annectens TaxID=7888 RepID=UPI001CF94ED7|nr:cytochrome c oxidase subunit 7B, mitochondrial-like [Protopterus annectens]
MFPFSSTALNLSCRSIRRVALRRNHHKAGPTFQHKYGNMILASGTVFCTDVWACIATQIVIVWNFSAVDMITPKKWRPSLFL